MEHPSLISPKEGLLAGTERLHVRSWLGERDLILPESWSRVFTWPHTEQQKAILTVKWGSPSVQPAVWHCSLHT